MLKINKAYLIIFSLSIVVLSFEIILARIFSYILTYHFVYIIIALAILSHAFGQFYASRVVQRDSYNLIKYFTFLQILFPVTIILIFILPSINIIGSTSTGLVLYIILAGIPFLYVGLICGILFHEYREIIGLLYAIDLIGAALGSVLGLFLLNQFNLLPIISVLLLIIAICSFIIFIKDHNTVHRTINILIALMSILVINLSPDINISIATSLDKDLLRLQTNPNISSRILDTRWNSFGRTDLVEFIYPDSSKSKSMFIDGAAGTEMIEISELERDSIKRAHLLMHSNLYFPFNFLKPYEKDSALIIGPGGGLDIAVAYFGKVTSIDAVEVNPTFVDMMTQYNKSTFYEKSNVNVYVQEGRNFVRNTSNKYDLIFLTIPITKGVRSADFINLTENYLFTLNAIEDYLSKLTDEGRIVLTLHNREEVYKILANYLELQLKKGVSNSVALNNIYVVDRGMKPLLVIKKNPFTTKEISQRHLLSHQLSFDRGITFFPQKKQISLDSQATGLDLNLIMFDKILYDISKNEYDFHDISNKASINLHPVTDDSPFFFNYAIGVPDNLSTIIFVSLILFSISIYMFKNNWGIVFEKGSVNRNPNRSDFRLVSYISFILGLTYILIQSYLFQKLNLYLSNPLNSFSVLLFTFLLGNGLGSYLSQKIKKNRFKYVGFSIIFLILLLLFEILWLTNASTTSFSLTSLGLVVFAPAVFVGIPFPLLLAESNLKNVENGIPILLGISGIASFIGSVIVLVLAMTFGYNYIIVLGIFLYTIILIVIFFQMYIRP